MQDWYPNAIRNVAPQNLWGSYSAGPFRVVLHTTEAKSFSPSQTTYYGHTSYPHFTTVWKDGKCKVFQHIPISRAARALVNKSGGVETNRRSAIQIEIAWRAAEAPSMPQGFLDGMKPLLRWVEQQTGVQRVSADDFHYYPPENGHKLGYEPWRMPNDKWNSFNGYCGHQHVPDGNVHGDPGKINIKYLLGGTPPAEEDLVRDYRVVTIPPPDGDGRQMVSFSDIKFASVSSVSVKANDNGIPVNCDVQPFEYMTALVVTFFRQDKQPVSQGNVGLIIERR